MRSTTSRLCRCSDGLRLFPGLGCAHLSGTRWGAGSTRRRPRPWRGVLRCRSSRGPGSHIGRDHRVELVCGHRPGRPQGRATPTGPASCQPRGGPGGHWLLGNGGTGSYRHDRGCALGGAQCRQSGDGVACAVARSAGGSGGVPGCAGAVGARALGAHACVPAVFRMVAITRAPIVLRASCAAQASLPLAEAVAAARARVDAGAKEIVLTGTSLGAYGRDLGLSEGLAKLVVAILPIRISHDFDSRPSNPGT